MSNNNLNTSAEAVNNKTLELIKQPNFDSDYVFDNYKSLGDTCTFKGRGIIDSDKKRELNLNQFFTPYSVVQFMTKALALDETETPIVYDNSCGIGRLFRYLPESARILGVEIEENAHRVAKALFPEAQIAHGNLVDYTKLSKQVDVAVINPPFSIQIERENMQLENASWGKLGPGSSIKSHIAAIELAIRAAKHYVIAFLPQSFFESEDTVKIDRWIQNRAKLVMKIDIAGKAFSSLKDNAFNWPCCVAIYDCGNYYHGDVFTKSIESLEELESALTEWYHTDYYNRYIKSFVRDVNEYPSDGVKLEQDAQLDVQLLKFKRTIPETGRKDVKICLDANASQLKIKCYDLLTALKVKEFMDAHGKSYDYGDSIWVDYWWTRTRRNNAFYDYSIPVHIKEELEKYGLSAEIDNQLRCYMLKLQKWYQRQEAKFEQWVKDGDDWKEIYEEEGITSKYDKLYYQRRVELERTLAKYPELTLWDWQKEDVARAAMKDSVLLASDMGLGKCLLPDAEVYVNGTLMKIDDIWEAYHTEALYDGEGFWSEPSKPLFVNSIDKNGKIVKARVKALYKQDIDEDIKRVTLWDGSEIECTTQHKFLTPNGWNNSPKKHIAIPKRLTQQNGRRNRDQVEFLAWQIAEGHERHSKYPYQLVITQKDVNVLRALQEKFKAFGIRYTPKIEQRKRRTPALYISNKEYHDMLISKGYNWGQVSEGKDIPDFIMRADKSTIRIFLQSYFSAEGSVLLSMRSIEIASASEKIIKKLGILLRRFGIWMQTTKKRKRATNGLGIYRTYWIATIGGNSLRIFNKEIGFPVGEKQEKLSQIANVKPNTNIETIPASKILKEIVYHTGIPAKSLGIMPVYMQGTQEFSINSIKPIIQKLEDMISLYPSLDFLSERRKKRYRKQITEHYSKLDFEWLKGKVAELKELVNREVYYARVKTMEKRHYKGPVYDLVIGEHHNFVANGMICHNTRQLISLALLRKHKRNLIIVESRLIGTFVDEFKKVGINNYQIIGNQDDLRHLKLFNLISYSKLWRPISNRTKKTFAKALRKRFKFIAIDEAQNIKAKDSRQAIAVRSLKAKHKVLATGTPVMNYPRNIFSLNVWGWGDGSELNPYGYHTPFFSSGTNSVTSGTKAFKEDFIVVEWVTPQFEETLDRGRKQREMPKIKDIDKWYELMAPKMIRRVKEEPDVKADVKIPDPVIEEIDVKPSKPHLEFYKLWLLNFAEWFEEQMQLERDTYGEHRMKGAEILAQLSKLQFASTIPQSPRVNDPKIAMWNGQGMTEKQKRTIELAMRHVRNGEKVIIYSQRPEFQKYIHDELIKIGVRSLVFTGQQTIKKRGEILGKFKRGSIPILLATTTVGGSGLNLYEASAVIVAERSWNYKSIIQAFSRILRPEQQVEPHIYLLSHSGTIDGYMKQLNIMKEDAIQEIIDYQASTWDSTTWMSYKDFSLKMLKEEGLM